VNVIHFSKHPNLNKLNPKYQGTGSPGAEKEKEDYKKPPYINLYVLGSDAIIEDALFNKSYAYVSKVDKRKLYDIDKEEGKLPYEEIKTKYDGVYYKDKDVYQVHYFKSLPVKLIGQLHSPSEMVYGHNVLNFIKKIEPEVDEYEDDSNFYKESVILKELQCENSVPMIKLKDLIIEKNIPEFIRYGGLSAVKQKGYGSEGFHSPPTRHGIYAFPANNIEKFLLGGYDDPSKKGTANRKVYVKDKHGKVINSLHPDWQKYMDDESDTYQTVSTKKLKPNAVPDKNGEYSYDDYIHYLIKDVKPKKFKYDGNIWHHLKEFVFPQEIIKEKGTWIYTTMDVYQKAFHRNYHDSKKQMYRDKYHGIHDKKPFDIKYYPKNPLNYHAKDYLEVFIDGNDINKIK
jgi:hypothetical protein